MIEFHDPRGESAVANTPYELSIQLRGTNQVTLGLLANGFPDSVNFLNRLGEAIAHKEPGIKLEHYDKGNASVAANDEMLADITQKCDAVIAAYGH